LPACGCHILGLEKGKRVQVLLVLKELALEVLFSSVFFNPKKIFFIFYKHKLGVCKQNQIPTQRWLCL
jgi:hypothetical protein